MKSPNSPLLAYIVVGWNNMSLLEMCLSSIEAQKDVQKTIYYVDNASGDNSIEFVKKHFHTVEIIKNKENFGFAKANNIGIKRAISEGADYIVLVNSDAELTPNWSKTIVEFAKKHPDSACLQGMTLRKNEKKTIDSRGIFLDENLVATQIDYLEKYKAPYPNYEVFGVNAAAALYTVEFLNKQKMKEEYFDEDFFMYIEDVDICLRAVGMGYNNYCVSNAKAYHIGSASTKGQKFGFKLSYRNHSALLYKNFPLRFILRMTPKLIASDIHRILGFKRNKQSDVSWAIVQGRINGIGMLLKMHKKRKLVAIRDKANMAKIIGFMQKGYITLK